MKNKYTIFLTSAIWLLITSCTTVHKLFHKNKSQIDSTTVTYQKKDSSAINDEFTIRKLQTENSDEIVVDYGDKQIVVPYNDTTNDSGIYITPKNPDDYFYFNSKTGEIKGNKTPVKITIKGKAVVNNFDSLANHSQIQTSDLKTEDTKVINKEKDVTNEVHKKRTFTFLWWLLLLIPAYLIYRNWPKIKAFAIHLITGL